MNKYIKKWRETHRDEYNKYMRSKMVFYRENNRQRECLNRMKRYYWKKASKMYLAILLDE